MELSACCADSVQNEARVPSRTWESFPEPVLVPTFDDIDLDEDETCGVRYAIFCVLMYHSDLIVVARISASTTFNSNVTQDELPGLRSSHGNLIPSITH